MITLDELKDGDEVYEFDGIEIVMNKKLSNKVAPVKIDFVVRITGKQFVISSNQLPATM